MISTEAASKIALCVVIYHLFSVTVAYVIYEWTETNKRLDHLRRIGALAILVAFSSCETAPIKVVDRPDIKAITTQNETTKKHIKTFTGHTKNVQEHIDVSIEEGAKEKDNLQSVKKDLEELLKQ